MVRSLLKMLFYRVHQKKMDAVMDRILKKLTSREVEETLIFCHAAAEALVTGFICIFISLFNEQEGRTHKYGNRIKLLSLKPR